MFAKCANTAHGFEMFPQCTCNRSICKTCINCESENAQYLLLQFAIDGMLGSAIRPANIYAVVNCGIAVMALAMGSQQAELSSNAE